MEDETTLHDCKVDSIIDCVEAWERAHQHGTTDRTPADCAQYILACVGKQKIDTIQIAEAVQLLDRFARACESKYMGEVAARMVHD